MTEPTNESPPDAPPQPITPPQPTAAETAVAPPAAVAPVAAAVFAPVARPPRQPWVNPARRLHIAAVAVVGALIFAGGGIAIGNSFGGGHDGRGGQVRIERNYMLPGGGPGQFGLPGNGKRARPNNGNPPAAPNSTPTPSKTS